MGATSQLVNTTDDSCQHLNPAVQASQPCLELNAKATLKPPLTHQSRGNHALWQCTRGVPRGQLCRCSVSNQLWYREPVSTKTQWAAMTVPQQHCAERQPDKKDKSSTPKCCCTTRAQCSSTVLRHCQTHTSLAGKGRTGLLLPAWGASILSGSPGQIHKSSRVQHAESCVASGPSSTGHTCRGCSHTCSHHKLPPPSALHGTIKGPTSLQL